MLPPQQTRRSAPPIIKLSRLDHAAIALAVYASQCGSPRPTQDSLPAGGQPLPCGTLTRWVRNRRFQVIATSSIPLPQACPGASLFLVYFNGASFRPTLCLLLGSPPSLASSPCDWPPRRNSIPHRFESDGPSL